MHPYPGAPGRMAIHLMMKRITPDIRKVKNAMGDITGTEQCSFIFMVIFGRICRKSFCQGAIAFPFLRKGIKRFRQFPGKKNFQ